MIKRTLITTLFIATLLIVAKANADISINNAQPVSLKTIEVIVDGNVELSSYEDLSAWQIESEDDSNYSTNTNPISIDRFSLTLNADNRGTEDDDDHWHQTLSDVILRHKFYLAFETSLDLDKTYTLTTPNSEIVTITIGQGTNGASKAIKINQHGYYLNTDERYAYVGYWMGTKGGLEIGYPLQFTVYNLDDQSEVLSGNTNDRGYDSTTGEYVHEINLGSLGAGEYYIEIDTIGRSYPFKVGTEAYEAYYTSARGLYHQRCGTSLTSSYTHWPRGTAHENVYKVDVLENWGAFFDENTSTDGEQIAVPGGWHDAGDFDRRPLHASTVSYLLILTEIFGDRLGDSLDIPESGDGLPDIFNEALYGLRLWEILQEDDGGVRSGIESYRHPVEGSTGGTDPLPYWTYNRNRLASYQFAALASHALRIFEGYKDQLSGELLNRYNSLKTKAIAAWDWAEANDSEVGTTTPYGAQNLEDLERVKMWAAAELYYSCLTVEGMSCAETSTYLNNLCIYDNGSCSSGFVNDYINPSYYRNMDTLWPMAIMDPLQVPGSDRDVVTYIKNLAVNKIQYSANDYLNYTNNPLNRYRNGLNPGSEEDYLGNPEGKPGYPIAWGSGSTTVHYMSPVVMAYHFNPSQEYIDAVSLNVDYQRGTNTRGQSWITGLGFNTPENPLHLDSLNDDIDQPVPGIPINGPFANEYSFTDYFEEDHAGDEDYFIEYWKFYVYYKFYPEATNNYTTTGTPFMHHYSPWFGMAPMNEFVVWGDMNSVIMADAFLYAVSSEEPKEMFNLGPDDYPLNLGYLSFSVISDEEEPEEESPTDDEEDTPSQETPEDPQDETDNEETGDEETTNGVNGNDSSSKPSAGCSLIR